MLAGADTNFSRNMKNNDIFDNNFDEDVGVATMIDGIEDEKLED